MVAHSPGNSESPGIRADILSASSRSHIEAMQVAISPGQKPVRPDILDLGSRLLAAGQAYVALSRVRSLDGIRIEELDCYRQNSEKRNFVNCGNHSRHISCLLRGTWSELRTRGGAHNGLVLCLNLNINGNSLSWHTTGVIWSQNTYKIVRIQLRGPEVGKHNSVYANTSGSLSQKTFPYGLKCGEAGVAAEHVIFECLVLQSKRSRSLGFLRHTEEGLEQNTWRCSICRRKMQSRTQPVLAQDSTDSLLDVPVLEALQRRHSDVKIGSSSLGVAGAGASGLAPPRSPELRRHSDVSPASLKELEKVKEKASVLAASWEMRAACNNKTSVTKSAAQWKHHLLELRDNSALFSAGRVTASDNYSVRRSVTDMVGRMFTVLQVGRENRQRNDGERLTKFASSNRLRSCLYQEVIVGTCGSIPSHVAHS
ncbi:hypothetical protein J6590_047871 [Homalodisca vitripennis]|nr:hypothetical protein J6590_047871 [Homalodisca vitripennis]